MRLHIPLDQVAQNQYLQVFEGAQLRSLQRGIGHVHGSFNLKAVRSHAYWYFQYTGANGKLIQFFVGPDSPQLAELISSKRAAPPDAHLRTLNDLALSAGCRAITSEHFKVLNPLEQHGLFAAGAVLVGTHAFIAYGNSLGIRWIDQAGTEDLDFAHAGRSLSLALPSNFRLDTSDVIQSLNMGFLPATTFGKVFGGSFVHPRQPEFRLDFLTPKTSQSDDPVINPQLGTALQPLQFIGFSLEDLRQAVLLSPLGPILVTVPSPARYCVHKLLVYGERTGAYTVKANKDLLQSAALAQWFLDYRPDELLRAEQDLRGRGKGWERRFSEGLRALAARYPAIAQAWDQARG